MSVFPLGEKACSGAFEKFKAEIAAGKDLTQMLKDVLNKSNTSTKPEPHSPRSKDKIDGSAVVRSDHDTTSFATDQPEIVQTALNVADQLNRLIMEKKQETQFNQVK